MNSLTADNLTSEGNCSVRVEPSGKRNCNRANALRAAEALSRWSCSWALWAVRRRSSSLVWAAWYLAARSILSWEICCRILSNASFSSRFSFWRESTSSRCSRQLLFYTYTASSWSALSKRASHGKSVTGIPSVLLLMFSLIWATSSSSIVTDKDTLKWNESRFLTCWIKLRHTSISTLLPGQ